MKTLADLEVDEKIWVVDKNAKTMTLHIFKGVFDGMAYLLPTDKTVEVV